jgi:hypothetical protein
MMGTPAANDGLDYERIGRFIYGFHRICNPARLTELARDASAPQELVQRAANLAKTFENILATIGTVTDSELESTLSEATDVQKAIVEWQLRSKR